MIKNLTLISHGGTAISFHSCLKRSWKNTNNLKAWYLNSVITISFFPCYSWTNWEQICGNTEWILDNHVSEKVVGPLGSNSWDQQLKIWVAATLGVGLLPLGRILFNDWQQPGRKESGWSADRQEPSLSWQQQSIAKLDEGCDVFRQLLSFSCFARFAPQLYTIWFERGSAIL